jgi:cyclic nucleotide-binding protein
MRIERVVTSISWIPSEAITGSMKVPFQVGMAHYDAPLPDVIEDLEALRMADRFRFANELRAWIEVEDSPEGWGGRTLPARGTGARITKFGYSGGGHIGSTTLRLGAKEMTFAAVAYPTLQKEPEQRPDSVRFVQTSGGRTGAPAPRPVPHPPFFRIAAPTAWTTLSLTLYADGRSEFEATGASPFPRHWIYDNEGKLAAKTGLIDFKDWSKHAFGVRTPWGEEDAPALVTEVETALERELSYLIMRGGHKTQKRKVKKGRVLTEQGSPGDELYLLLDGVLQVDVDGNVLAELGPGAVLGERALLEGGRRTSTLRALTPCTVAVARAEDVNRASLEELSKGHRREEAAEANGEAGP